jgi:hypothetical protein
MGRARKPREFGFGYEVRLRDLSEAQAKALVRAIGDDEGVVQILVSESESDPVDGPDAVVCGGTEADVARVLAAANIEPGDAIVPLQMIAHDGGPAS